MTQDNITYTMRETPVARIRAFAQQPRKWFNPEEIRLRADSMRATGQQAPVTVEPVTGDPNYDYELIDGESRLRSAQQAGLQTLWAAVRSKPFPSVAAKHLSSLVANFNRSGHTPMEISDALHLQVTEGDATVVDLARSIGKTTAYIYSYLSLQKLHPTVKMALPPTGKLPTNAALELARLPQGTQVEVLTAATDENGRVFMSKIEAAIDRIVVRRKRGVTPSKRKEKIANRLKGVRTETDKLLYMATEYSSDVATAIRNDDAIDESVESLELAQSIAKLQNRDGKVPMPRMLDTHKLPESQLADYLEMWRQYWMKVGVNAERKNQRDPLLIQIAYGRRPTPRRRD